MRGRHVGYPPPVAMLTPREVRQAVGATATALALGGTMVGWEQGLETSKWPEADASDDVPSGPATLAAQQDSETLLGAVTGE